MNTFAKLLRESSKLSAAGNRNNIRVSHKKDKEIDENIQKELANSCLH